MRKFPAGEVRCCRPADGIVRRCTNGKREYQPLAVLLSLPQWTVAGFAWCGISGCSGGGFRVAAGTEWVAVILSDANGVILAVAVCS
jgi:hypothetical protein